MVSFILTFPVEMSQRCRGSGLEKQTKYSGIHFWCGHLCCGHLVCEFLAQNWGYRKSLYGYWEVTTQLCKSNYCSIYQWPSALWRGRSVAVCGYGEAAMQT